MPGQLLSTTFAQLADLLHSGVPLLRSLEVIQKQTSHAGLNHILDEVHHQVEEGATLADAMNRFPRIFNDMAISMIRAGGEGGFLEEALTRVAQFTEAQEDMKKRTLGAVAYPAFLCVVGTIVVIVLIVFFVPKFGELFARLRERNELPPVTDWLLWFSDTLRMHGWWIVLVLIAAGWFARRWLTSPEGGMWRDRMQLKIALGRPDFSESGRGPILPRAGHPVAQRRADHPLAGNLAQRHGQPRAGRGHRRSHRKHLGRPIAGRTAAGQRPVSARRGRNDRRGRTSE